MLPYTDSIEDLGDSCGPLFVIFFDARNIYHQIIAREFDQEKLTFSLAVEQKKRIKFFISALRMLQHFTLL